MGRLHDILKRSGLKGLAALYDLLKRGAYGVLPRLPICRRKIIFDNFAGKGFGDDPKYIALELLRRDPSLKMYWVLKNPDDPLPRGIRPLKHYGFMTAYQFHTAKIWVDNVKDYVKPEKRPGQYYIQTWHSTLGFKKNEQDALTLDEEYVAMAKRDAAMTDLMYSNNDFRLDKYRSRYWYSGEVRKCSVPRMSPLYERSPQLVQKVRDALNLGSEQIALYAPTFRDGQRYADYAMDVHRCLCALEKRFAGERFVMLVRLHPNEYRRFGPVAGDEGCVRDASAYPDMQELLAAADVLITDYSGCMFDFGFVNKPAFLFTKDYEHYRSRERGVYFSVDETPFFRADTDDELEQGILSFSQEAYEQKCEAFRRRIGYCDDGSGSRVLAELILEKMGR